MLLALSVILAIWVLVDGRKRGANYLAWGIGTAILGPLAVSFYLSRRPLKAGETREGGPAWNVLKNFAVFWTLYMAGWAGLGLISVGGQMGAMQSDAERVGGAIGATLGFGLIAVVWFFPFVAATVLGLILKKSVVEKGPTGPLAQTSPGSSIKNLLLLLSFMTVIPAAAFSMDKTYILTVQQLEDFAIESNGVRLNNFSISEKRAFMTNAMSNIEVSFSARNRGETSRHFAVMLVGMDEKGILWSLSLEPLMSTLAEKATENVEGSIYVFPGTLRKTTKIWVRAIGDF